MASGVAIDDEVVSVYNELKLKQNKRYIILSFSADARRITLETVGERPATWEEFCAKLPKDDCRYAVFDYEFSLGGGEGDRSKLLFVLWAPDTAPVRRKTLITSSKAALRKALVGVAAELQATDASEIDKVEVEKTLRRS
ncbi:cofilin [Pelomyxa schiedti]|nr:cofilin [Pelomyxa schiedti]